MKAQRLFIPFLAGLLTFETVPVGACPIVRRPLWSLMKDSDLIALVQVEAFEREELPVGSKPVGIERDVVVLKILETYKGSLRTEVRVRFFDSLYAGDHEVAPGDPLLVFLEAGETQIRRRLELASEIEREGVFVDSTGEQSGMAGSSRVLIDEATVEDGVPSAEDPGLSAEDRLQIQEAERRWEESRRGHWFVAGEGLAVIRVDADERDALDDLMTAAVGELEGDGPTPETARGWLVSAVGIRSTRPFALEDLEQLLAIPRDPPQGELHESGLSEAEQRSIASGFVRDPIGDGSLPALLGLLDGFDDADLDRAVVSVIDAAFEAPETPWWVPEAIRFLIARRGWRDWGSEMWRRDLEGGELRQRWPLTRKDLHLSSGSAGGLR